MLLAFFIILNAISTYEEEKFQPIVKSLETAFSNDLRREGDGPSMAPSPLQSVHDGETVERLDALFNAQLRGFKTTKSVISGRMTVEMDLADFQEAVSAIGQKTLTPSNSFNPPRKYFLPTLVSILQSDKQGYDYRMEILLQTEENPARLQNREPAAVKEKIDLAGMLAQRLENEGMPQKHLNIGLREGNPSKVTLVFMRHVPFSPVEEEGTP